MRKVELFRLWNDIFHCNHVLAGHAAMRADGCNFAIHKDFFLQEGGFTTGRNLKSGAVELLANQCSTCDNTALMLSPGTLVIEERSWDARQWKQERIFDVETRHHRQHAFSYHLKAALQQAMPVLVVFSLLLFWLSCGVLFLSDVLVDSETGLFDSSDFTAMLSPTLWLAAVLSVLMLIVYFTALVRNFKRSAHQLGYDRLNTFLLLVFLFSLPFWSLSATWAHRRTSKNDFRKKFV